jgi:hypothetical protein
MQVSRAGCEDLQEYGEEILSVVAYQRDRARYAAARLFCNEREDLRAERSVIRNHRDGRQVKAAVPDTSPEAAQIITDGLLQSVLELLRDIPGAALEDDDLAVHIQHVVECDAP